jgi:nitrate reductase delta subunit
MTRTLKALSALLNYPSAELVAARREIEGAILSEGLVAPEVAEALGPLFADFATLDLLELQERYVDLFDKTRRLSLHLFEHVHGEGRDRGQAMVDLASLYEKAGLHLTARELPDYLPAFLEYASTLALDEARALVADTAHILARLEERLEKRGSPYAAVIAAIRSATDVEILRDAAASAAEPESDDLAALDAAWEETAVTFGPGDATGGCSVDRLRTQIRAGRRDARNAAA